jgi:hypothetical protein
MFPMPWEIVGFFMVRVYQRRASVSRVVGSTNQTPGAEVSWLSPYHTFPYSFRLQQENPKCHFKKEDPFFLYLSAKPFGTVCACSNWRALRSLYVQLIYRTTGYELDGRSSIPGRDHIFFSSPQRPYQLWDPASLLSNGYRGLLPRGYSGRGPSSAEVKNGEAIPPSPPYICVAWCLIKLRNL